MKRIIVAALMLLPIVAACKPCPYECLSMGEDAKSIPAPPPLVPYAELNRDVVK